MTEDLPNLGPDEMTADLSTIKPFDKSYLRMMIQHVQKGARAAQLAATSASHPELKELAGEMAARKQDELARFQRLLHQWYPETKALTHPR